jgi:hypothetical protein
MANAGRAILGSLAAGLVALSAAGARAESFEFVTYAPPPGWTVQDAQGERIYVRKDAGGTGVAGLHAGLAPGSAEDAFAAAWRANVGQVVGGPPPSPEIRREGEFTVAVGAKRGEAQGAAVSAVLVTIVGRGRAVSAVGVASEGEALRQATAFLDSVTVGPGVPPVARREPPPGPAAQAGAGVEIDFEVPPGYAARTEGGSVVLVPPAGEATGCTYGLSPPRPSRGRLDADAEAALVEVVLPGWQRSGAWTSATRGSAAAGWPYHSCRADLHRDVGGSRDYATAMAMVLPAGTGRVHVVWGRGNPARCTLDDAAFARLFHSLRPRGWTPDGGKALLRDLQGTWRDTESHGVQQYRFLAGGRYEYGIGTVTRLGLLERTSSSAVDGRYEMRGSELVLTPERKDRDPSRRRVRVYEEYTAGRWWRFMSLFGESGEVRFDWIEPQR